jgi:hypothetical protein
MEEKEVELIKKYLNAVFSHVFDTIGVTVRRSNFTPPNFFVHLEGVTLTPFKLELIESCFLALSKGKFWPDLDVHYWMYRSTEGLEFQIKAKRFGIVY